mmetsp:Transcript_6960/g.18929  ORF Transcript_6960/g.18929 Transcript_6960/m.18929 type:complete len:225 (+) Transcript_6960:162-836(+)
MVGLAMEGEFEAEPVMTHVGGTHDRRAITPAASAHEAAPMLQRALCTDAPLSSLTLGPSLDGAWRVFMPSAQAASAHAKVSAYAGIECATARPVPRAVPTAADAWPAAITARSEMFSSIANEPLRFTRVAAVVQPKCIVRGMKMWGTALVLPTMATLESIATVPTSMPAETYLYQPELYLERKEAHQSDWKMFAATKGAVISGRTSASAEDGKHCTPTNATSPR